MPQAVVAINSMAIFKVTCEVNIAVLNDCIFDCKLCLQYFQFGPFFQNPQSDFQSIQIFNLIARMAKY